MTRQMHMCDMCNSLAAVRDVNDLQALEGKEAVPICALPDRVRVWASVPEQLALPQHHSSVLLWIALKAQGC